MSTLEREEERLRAEIRRDSAGLREAVDELQSVATRRINARYLIARQPFAWLAGALLVGWFIGSRTK